MQICTISVCASEKSGLAFNYRTMFVLLFCKCHLSAQRGVISYWATKQARGKQMVVFRLFCRREIKGRAGNMGLHKAPFLCADRMVILGLHLLVTAWLNLPWFI